MAYDALAVANYFLDRAEKEGKSLTPMAVQKLVYFAHGWHLALLDEPLIEKRVQAWEYGPVIPDIYTVFRGFGKAAITRRATCLDFTDLRVGNTVNFDSFKMIEPTIVFGAENMQTKNLLDRVWDVYKGYSAAQLSNLTHQDGSPWSQTRQKSTARGVTIDDELIKQWFKDQAQKKAARREAANPT